MDKKAAIKELNYYLTHSLMYAHKPVTCRIELPLSEVLYEKIKDFNISGRFKSCDWLEDYLRLEKRAVYSDGYTVQLEMFLFRVEKAKEIKGLSSRKYQTSPRLIVKYIRSGSMPELV
jgi:hypothetical protein